MTWNEYGLRFKSLIFKTEVVPLRNYYYEREAFKEDIVWLRKLLTDSENQEFLLKYQKIKNIPLDTFFEYAKNIWEAIVNNKEINIPD